MTAIFLIASVVYLIIVLFVTLEVRMTRRLLTEAGKVVDESLQTLRDRTRNIDAQQEALRHLWQAMKDVNTGPRLPDFTVVPCEEPGFEGWAEVHFSDHGDAVRVVMRLDDGQKSAHGENVLRILKQHVGPVGG